RVLFRSRIDDFYVIKEKAHARRKEHQVELEINMERLGNKVIELHNVSKSFNDKVILDKYSYNFLPGERIGVIGKNGTGKSTFLNILTQKIQPDRSEERRVGKECRSRGGEEQ